METNVGDKDKKINWPITNKNQIMETKTIAKVNNVDIVSTNDEQMVAIKPICEALGMAKN